MKRTIYVFISICLILTLTSCSTAPVHAPYTVKPCELTSPISLPTYGTMHTVTAGETLWHLSKMYNVNIDDIIKANKLIEPVVLEVGQHIFIPPTISKQPTIPLYATSKWQYIIIHHSATNEGDAWFINRLHKRRGWEGIGYDFIIDNGTLGKEDGAIEVSPRWLKQENGAHCRASDMNCKGIGICLVGNFSKERVSKKQLDSLVYLTNLLKKYYKIPVSHIMGHGQVPEAKTECPGKFFPWEEFKNELQNRN